MKWFWWLTGAALFLVVKVEFGDDSPGMYAILFGILLVFTLLGQSADASQKKREQEERDDDAAKLATNIRQELDEERKRSIDSPSKQ